MLSGGFGGGSTTTEVKTGDLSALGREMESIYKDAILQNLQDFGGYDMTPSEKKEYQNPQQAGQFQAQLKTHNDRLTALNQRLNSLPTLPNGQLEPRARNEAEALKREIRTVENRRNQAQENLDRQPQTTFTSWDLKKKEDPRVQRAIEQYGEGSNEVRQAREQIKADAVSKAEAMAGVERSYLENIQKLARGDLSYTPEQQAQVDQYIGPIKDLILKSTDQLLKTAGDNNQVLNEELNKLSTEIDRSGYDIASALEAAAVQAEQSGATLTETLQKANQSSRDKAKFEFDLLSRKADQKAAQQAALLGLPPGSMAERAEAARIKSEALQNIELNLAERESQGLLGIQSDVEQAKKSIALSKVALAETQGGKRESVAGQRFGLAQDLAGTRFGLDQNKQNALLGLEQQRQGALQQQGFGLLPQLVQAGQSGLSFNQGLTGQQLANQAGILAPVQGLYGQEQNRTMAETTTTQRRQLGFLDALSDVVGMGAAAAGAVQGFMPPPEPKPKTTPVAATAGGGFFGGQTFNTQPVAYPQQQRYFFP